MSAEAMALALHHSRAKGTAKLVLIGIANHDGDGGAWPSVATLAKYAGVDARSVQRAIVALEKLGEIRRVIGGGGTNATPDHSRPNLYEVQLRCPDTCDGTKNHNTSRRLHGLTRPLTEGVTPVSPPDASVTGGVTPVSPPDASVTGGVTPVSPEQYLEPTTQLKEIPHVLKRGREATCRHGHPLEVISGSGAAYCVYGCAGGAA